MHIAIPDIFSNLNSKRVYRDFWADYRYKDLIKTYGKASDCIKCGACEAICPQHLEIRKLLEDAVEEFEK